MAISMGSLIDCIIGGPLFYVYMEDQQMYGCSTGEESKIGLQMKLQLTIVFVTELTMYTVIATTYIFTNSY